MAHRKCRALLDRGARVLFVARKIPRPVAGLAASGRVELREGSYEPGVLSTPGLFLVYAATDDNETNRRIVGDARRRGILASSVSCWEEGDFISPSVIQWGTGQLSITTEGASCRQARFMRIRLDELLGGERRFVAIGVDRRTLTLEEFEGVRPDAARIAEIEEMLRHVAVLEEFALLATCDRLELYAWTQGTESLLRTVRVILGIEEFSSQTYVPSGDAVLEHAASVVSGRLSEVPGQTQIVGQWKEAFARAFARNVTGVHLQSLYDQTLAAGRKLRVLDLRRFAGPEEERKRLLAPYRTAPPRAEESHG